MSDPVTNAEVEDVLSSIRRLVSEDKRPLQAQKPEPKNSRLVLTPALRVENKPTDSSSESAPVSDASETEGSSDELSLGGLIMDDVVVEVFPHTEDVSDDHEEDFDTEELFDDPAEDYSADPYNFEDDRDESGETTETLVDASLEVSTTDASVTEEGHLSEEWAKPDTGHDTEMRIDQANDASIDPEPATASVQVDQPSPADIQAEVKAATLSAKIAALETAIGNIAEAWEPDDAGEGDNAGSEPEAMEWQDDETSQEPDNTTAFASVDQTFEQILEPAHAQPAHEQPAHEQPAEAQNREQEPVSETPSPEPEAAAMGFGDDEQLLDEDALRDLVSDIVRAELQGALGERITRNVRKLVRREIHRALTAQELE
ncbi:MAG: hypothetical protein ABJL67_02065 [Sulfitobacter sp.]